MICVPVINPALNERLCEWGRWARQRRWLSFCRSIEGRFRPEAGNVWDREPRALPIDALDAWHVECCWRLGLPLRERLILRAYFVTAPGGSSERRTAGEWHAYTRRMCRSLGIPRGEFELAVSAAARMLNNVLRREDKRWIIARKKSLRLAEDAPATTAPMRSSSMRAHQPRENS